MCLLTHISVTNSVEKIKIIIPILQIKKLSDGKRFNLGNLNLNPIFVLTTLKNKNGISLGCRGDFFPPPLCDILYFIATFRRSTCFVDSLETDSVWS